MTKVKQTKENAKVSSVLMVSLMFIVHTITNAYLLSPRGKEVRCLFWDKDTCSEDEAWILNWFAFSHFHVGALLTSLAYVSIGNTKLESTLCYVVVSIVFVYMAEGIFSADVLNLTLVSVQASIFVLMLVATAIFTAEEERRQPFFPLPNKLTTSSFDRRKKLSVATIALIAQFAGSLFRVVEMVLGGGHSGYTGDMNSLVYQSISKMALCDMMVVTGIMGAAIRFYDPTQHKIVLWAQVAALLVSQAMLAGTQGELIEIDQKEAGAIGNFISLVTATLGAL